MTATLVQASNKEAVFELQNGKRARLKLEMLVEDDRKRVDAFRQSALYWTTLPKDKRWPKRVSLNWLESKVDVITEGKDKSVYRTPHYEFTADAKLAGNLVKDFSRIFEVTHAALKQNPLGLRLSKPPNGFYKVRLFSSRQGYANAGGPLGTAGVYIPSKKEILVPFRSLGLRKANVAWVRSGQLYDPSTLLHEVTHQLLDQWLEVAPMWFTEGIAEVVGAARYDSGQLFFDRLEDGIKDGILGKRSDRIRASSYIRSLGPKGFQFPISPEFLLQASQAQFMGYPPAADLEQRRVVHHYQSATLLVHFAMNDGQQGASNFRNYLDAHRQLIQAKTVTRPKNLSKLSKEKAQGAMMAYMFQRLQAQKHAATKSYPKLLRGRSEEAYWEDLSRFYKPKGIIPTKER